LRFATHEPVDRQNVRRRLFENQLDEASRTAPKMAPAAEEIEHHAAREIVPVRSHLDVDTQHLADALHGITATVDLGPDGENHGPLSYRVDKWNSHR